jgi:hypothetical protein
MFSTLLPGPHWKSFDERGESPDATGAAPTSTYSDEKNFFQNLAGPDPPLQKRYDLRCEENVPYVPMKRNQPTRGDARREMERLFRAALWEDCEGLMGRVVQLEGTIIIPCSASPDLSPNGCFCLTTRVCADSLANSANYLAWKEFQFLKDHGHIHFEEIPVAERQRIKIGDGKFITHRWRVWSQIVMTKEHYPKLPRDFILGSESSKAGWVCWLTDEFCDSTVLGAPLMFSKHLVDFMHLTNKPLRPNGIGSAQVAPTLRRMQYESAVNEGACNGKWVEAGDGAMPESTSFCPCEALRSIVGDGGMQACGARASLADPSISCFDSHKHTPSPAQDATHVFTVPREYEPAATSTGSLHRNGSPAKARRTASWNDDVTVHHCGDMAPDDTAPDYVFSTTHARLSTTAAGEVPSLRLD